MTPYLCCVLSIVLYANNGVAGSVILAKPNGSRSAVESSISGAAAKSMDEFNAHVPGISMAEYDYTQDKEESHVAPADSAKSYTLSDYETENRRGASEVINDNAPAVEAQPEIKSIVSISDTEYGSSIMKENQPNIGMRADWGPVSSVSDAHANHGETDVENAADEDEPASPFITYRKERSSSHSHSDIDSSFPPQQTGTLSMNLDAHEENRKRHQIPIPVNRVNSRFPATFCELEKDSGIICPGLSRGLHIEQFFYDADNNRCSHFLYNGCGGNANRFSSLWECSQNCVKQSSDTN